jgi:hypothetical protein
LVRIVVAIDPAVSTGEDADETGIIGAGKDAIKFGSMIRDQPSKPTTAGVCLPRHKQGSEFQRWAAVNRRLRLPRLAILSRAGVRGCGPPGQNRVTPGGGAE